MQEQCANTRFGRWSFVCAGVASLVLGTAGAQTVVKTLPLPGTGGTLALDPVTNLLYAGGGNPGAVQVDIVDAYAFTVTQSSIAGIDLSVDRLKDNVWVPNVYSGNVDVYKSGGKQLLATIPLNGCPYGSAYGQDHKQTWVGAQCGSFNDPVYAIDSTTYEIKAGPIGFGGVFGGLLVNPPTGVAYVNENGCHRIDPVTYAVTTPPFASTCPLAADGNSGYLYVISGSTLQIWNGKTTPEKLVANVNLPYQVSYTIAVNDALKHLYIGVSGANTIDIRNSLNGQEIKEYTNANLPGIGGATLVADSTRGRLYANAGANGGQVLYVIDDISTIFNLGSLGY